MVILELQTRTQHCPKFSVVLIFCKIIKSQREREMMEEREGIRRIGQKEKEEKNEDNDWKDKEEEKQKRTRT